VSAHVEAPTPVFEGQDEERSASSACMFQRRRRCTETALFGRSARWSQRSRCMLPSIVTLSAHKPCLAGACPGSDPGRVASGHVRKRPAAHTPRRPLYLARNRGRLNSCGFAGRLRRRSCGGRREKRAARLDFAVRAASCLPRGPAGFAAATLLRRGRRAGQARSRAARGPRFRGRSQAAPTGTDPRRPLRTREDTACDLRVRARAPPGPDGRRRTARHP
jgi:hypothetical protein